MTMQNTIEQTGKNYNENLRFILINSTLAFVAAFFITTIFHECGHFSAYVLFGAKPVIFHNYVRADNSGLSETARIITLMAGPVFSLLQGTFFFFLLKIKKKGNAFALLNLWLCLLGFINFFGYLMLTPLSSAGDTGKIARILSFPLFSFFLIAGIGFYCLWFLILRIGIGFAEFIPPSKECSEKRKYAYFTIYWPIVIGSVVNILFSFPVPALVSVMYPAFSSFFVMTVFGQVIESNSAVSLNIGESMYKSLIFLNIILMVLNRVLVLGVS